jgi:hypothetical protein
VRRFHQEEEQKFSASPIALGIEKRTIESGATSADKCMK